MDFVFHRAGKAERKRCLKLKAESKGGTTYRARKVGGEVAEDLFERGLCLPSGTAMTEEDLDRVVRVIKKVRSEQRAVNKGSEQLTESSWQ